jgi:hypothetical protein
MKKVTSNALNNMVMLSIGMIIGMFVIGLTKPRYNKVKTVYTYVKLSDWGSEKNPRKIAYYEHLAR